MMFADGFVLVGESPKEVNESLDDWWTALERKGLRMSGSK